MELKSWPRGQYPRPVPLFPDFLVAAQSAGRDADFLGEFGLRAVPVFTLDRAASSPKRILRCRSSRFIWSLILQPSATASS